MHTLFDDTQRNPTTHNRGTTKKPQTPKTTKHNPNTNQKHQPNTTLRHNNIRHKTMRKKHPTTTNNEHNKQQILL